MNAEIRNFRVVLFDHGDNRFVVHEGKFASLEDACKAARGFHDLEFYSCEQMRPERAVNLH